MIRKWSLNYLYIHSTCRVLQPTLPSILPHMPIFLSILINKYIYHLLLCSFALIPRYIDAYMLLHQHPKVSNFHLGHQLDQIEEVLGQPCTCYPFVLKINETSVFLLVGSNMEIPTLLNKCAVNLPWTVLLRTPSSYKFLGYF